MSKNHDKHSQIRLTPENTKELDELHKAVRVPCSKVTLANYILERHGFPEFRKSGLLADAMKK